MSENSTPQAEAPVKTVDAPPAPFVPPSQLDPSVLAEAFKEAGLVSESAPANTEAPAPVAPPQTVTPAETPTESNLPKLLQLAKDKDTQRKLLEQKEIEAAKPYIDALKVIPPQNASAIARAIASGDPMELLKAAGMAHAAKSVGVEPVSHPPEAPVDEMSALKEQFQKLSQRLANEDLERARNKMFEQVKEVVQSSPKFQTLKTLGNFEKVEEVLIRYHSEHGRLPGDTLQESIELAAEVAEYEEQKMLEKYKPLLTPSISGADIQAKKVPEPQPSAGSATPKTLTNANTTAPAAPRTTPKTRDEILQLIIEGRDSELET